MQINSAELVNEFEKPFLSTDEKHSDFRFFSRHNDAFNRIPDERILVNKEAI